MSYITTRKIKTILFGLTFIGLVVALASVALAGLPWAAGSPVRADGSPPTKPTGLVVSTQPGSLRVSVDWADVDGATHYSVRWRVAGPGNTLNKGVNAQSSDTSITVAGHGEWVVRVEACNSAGCSGGLAKRFSVNSVPTPTPTPAVSVPARPSGLDVTTESGSFSVSMDWADVDGATHYSVRWRVAGPGNTLNKGVNAQSSDTSITVAGHGEWVVRVEACNSVGCSRGLARRFSVAPAPEPITAIFLPPVQVSPPPKPMALAATESSLGAVTLTWSAPADDGGSPITGYKIVRDQGLRSEVTLAADTASTSTSYVDDTVAPETKYFYYVRAINSAGVGDFEFDGIKTKLQTEGVPGPPGDLDGSSSMHRHRGISEVDRPKWTKFNVSGSGYRVA